MTALRFGVRVKPGAGRDSVGGRWREDALVVAVRAKAVEGQANAAVCALLATAFGVRRNDIVLVTGHRGRDKVVELDPAPDDARATLERLLAS